MLDRLLAADRAPSLCPCGPVLARLEAKLDAVLTNGHTSDLTGAAPGLLLGYAAIARYCHRRPGTIRGYRRSMAFPAIRWGRHVASSPALIDAWLLTVAQKKRQARLRQPTA